MTADRISTGLGLFDELLGGGIPAGSVVAITTPPAAPIGLLLAELVASADLDSVTYITTDRRPAAIRHHLGDPNADATTDSPPTEGDTLPPQIELIDARSDGVRTFGKAVEALPGPASRDTTTAAEAAVATQARETAGEPPADEHASQATPQATAETTTSAAGATGGAGAVDALVVDTFTGVLANPPDQWSAHFEALVEWVHETDGVAYLVLRLPPARTPAAAESQVLYRADVIFEYRRSDDGGSDDRVTVPRVRGGTRPSDPISLDISDHLGVNPDRRV